MFDEIVVPTDFSTLTDDQLKELDGQARVAAGPLVEKVNSNESLTADELDALERLGTVVESVKTERERRVSEAAVQTATASRTQSAVAAFATDAPAEGEKTGEAEGEDGEAAKKKTTAEADEADESKDKDGTVTAAVKPSVADVAAQAGNPAAAVPTAPAAERKSYATMAAAVTLPGVNAGHVFDNLDEAAKAIDEQMKTYSGIGPNQYVKTPALQIKRNYPAELQINAMDDQETVARKIDAAGSEANLPGGSLVAAAGWCAPSEILYDLFEIEDGGDGLLDLPEIQVNRGGIQYTTGPDFSTIWASSGYFSQTEAQVIAATSKPCMVIPCPTFTETRLDVAGVCITGSFLQDRGYPEMVARFVRGALAAHRRKLNVFKINKVVAGSTLVDLTVAANFGGAATSVENDDRTVASRLLAALEVQIMDYRYKHRMRQDATLEVVLPYWLVANIRADVQRRTGTSAEQAFDITNEMINRWFRLRGARPQWIYDWQDAFNGSGTVGGETAIGGLPTTVDILIYAAGTFVAGVADVVRLDTVYDSTNLAVNQFTQLFTEEGILVAKRGFESRRVKLLLEPTGITSATVAMTGAS